MRTLILIIFAIISYNIQGQLLSIKKLLQKPIYVYYNDTLFTLDENCNKVYPKSFTEIYRLKVYPLCERKLMPWCAPYDYPYYDFTKIGSLLGSMTNLQELNLYNLPLWEFPKEILSLKRIQILDLQIDIEDCVENNFFSQPIPDELWNIKTLKYLYLPTHDYSNYRSLYNKKETDISTIYTIHYYKPWACKLVPIPKDIKVKINDRNKLWKLRQKYDYYSPSKHLPFKQNIHCEYYYLYFSNSVTLYKTK